MKGKRYVAHHSLPTDHMHSSDVLGDEELICGCRRELWWVNGWWGRPTMLISGGSEKVVIPQYSWLGDEEEDE